jgi:hypothetical protein
VSLGTASQNVTADVSGAWSADFSAAGLADGTHAASAKAVDAAGNESAAASAQVTVDTTAPDAPTIAPASGQGLLLTGTAEAGTEVQVTLGTASQSVTADASGAWSADFSAAVSPTAPMPPALRLSTRLATRAPRSRLR